MNPLFGHMNERTVKTAIDVLQMKIRDSSEKLDLIHRNLQQTMTEISECGLYSHFHDLMTKLKSDNELMINHTKSINKWKKERDYLLNLIRKKQ